MELTAENKLKKLIVVGDRVLIKPLKESDKTTSGILLPPGVREKEKIQTGFIVKVGPGYPIPVPMDEDDAWKQEEDQMKYVPLQAKEGDKAIFLQNGAFEVTYEKEKYFIVSQASTASNVRFIVGMSTPVSSPGTIPCAPTICGWLCSTGQYCPHGFFTAVLFDAFVLYGFLHPAHARTHTYIYTYAFRTPTSTVKTCCNFDTSGMGGCCRVEVTSCSAGAAQH